MAETLAPGAAVSGPQITQDELHAFHATHFSTTQIETYAEQFLGPVEEAPADEYYEEPDDGLGYYEDGVKRTLTDEQIAMFRHSEIQALLRARRLTQEAADYEMGGEKSAIPAPEVEDGELGDDAVEVKEAGQAGKGKKRNGKKKKSWFKTNVKPDLRKRTWDVVETGLSSLDYEEEAEAGPVAKRSMQRQLISYDD